MLRDAEGDRTKAVKVERILLELFGEGAESEARVGEALESKRAALPRLVATSRLRCCVARGLSRRCALSHVSLSRSSLVGLRLSRAPLVVHAERRPVGCAYWKKPLRMPPSLPWCVCRYGVYGARGRWMRSPHTHTHARALFLGVPRGVWLPPRTV